jgi:hypothetical protein
MRSMFRSALIALVAVFALGALATTAAQAAEGPFYKVAGVRLKAGEKSSLQAKASKNYQIWAWGGSINFDCKQQKLAKGAVVVGSTGANPGTSQEIIEFSECRVEGDGYACGLEGGKLTTTEVSQELAYETKERTGKILVLFKPVSKLPGAYFVKPFHLVGQECKVKEMFFEGSVAAELWNGGKAVEVGKEPVEGLTSEVNFPEPTIKSLWVEKEGKIEERRPIFRGNFGAGIGAGRSILTLPSSWGVFTQ